MELNPQNLRAIYRLAEETERQGDENGAAEVQQLLQKILAAQPDNLAALLELSRIAAKRGDAATLKSAVAQISARSSAWPPEVQHQLAAVQSATAGPDLRPAATQTTFLRNVMMRVPEYRQSLTAIKAPPGDEAEPFTHFLRLESPVFRPAPADTAISFNPQPCRILAARMPAKIAGLGLARFRSAVRARPRSPSRMAARCGCPAARPSLPRRSFSVPPLPEGIMPVDFNYDFKTDLVLAGAGGVRLLRQDSPTAFTDVTAQAKLPKAVTNARYTGAWAVDIEADGDLDIVLGAEAGTPIVLRNNGDGTFLPIHPFAGISGIAGFAWADLDGDGNPDAAIIDGAGRLHVFMNLRQGQFQRAPAAARSVVGQSSRGGGRQQRRRSRSAGGASRRRYHSHFGQERRTKLGDSGDRQSAEPRQLSCGRGAPARRRSRQQRSARSVSLAHYADSGQATLPAR